MTTTNHTTTTRARTGRRDVVDNDAFTAFSGRVVRAYGRRVGDGDVEALRDLLALSTVLDHAITDAVLGLRAFGYSWAEIATRLGITRQAAHQRWATPTNPNPNGAAIPGPAAAGPDSPGGLS
jgi:hypothetical protein